jgi:hypothetical protein
LASFPRGRESSNQARAVNRFNTIKKDDTLAKPNYQFEKRQKEIEKKKKKEMKLQRKQGKESDVPARSEGGLIEDQAAPPAPAGDDLK